MADLIVLGGCAAVEQAAKHAGVKIIVPFVAGRVDATQEQTDVESFAVLEPVADGFRNYAHEKLEIAAEKCLIDKAQLLTLTIPEMTVLVGGMRALMENNEASSALTNEFFVNLLDMDIVWQAADKTEKMFIGSKRGSDKPTSKATRVDLIFGSNSQLRAVAEVYASSDAKQKFVRDFVAAWHKVMMLDRF